MTQHIDYKRAFTTDELHFSGGLRGELSPSSIIKIHPLRNNNFSTDDAPKITLGSLLDGKNIIMLGVNEKIKISGSSDITNIWHPSQKDKILSTASFDLWELVAYQAENSGDSDFANCARSISVSLRLAGLRLRDISDHYHEQLNWAIADKKPSNKWFTNLALLDIYADYHSFVSELSSTRDYIAKLAGVSIGAPEKIDSLARLESWLGKSINHVASSNLIVSSLVKASGTTSAPGWLRQLGQIRNEMLHKMPMGANSAVSGLILQDIEIASKEIQIIRLTDREKKNIDPLKQLVLISQNLEDLSKKLISYARYPATPPNYF